MVRQELGQLESAQPEHAEGFSEKHRRDRRFYDGQAPAARMEKGKEVSDPRSFREEGYRRRQSQRRSWLGYDGPARAAYPQRRGVRLPRLSRICAKYSRPDADSRDANALAIHRSFGVRGHVSI